MTEGGRSRIESPGFYPGLFGLDSFEVLWIPAFAGMTITPNIKLGASMPGQGSIVSRSLGCGREAAFGRDDIIQSVKSMKGGVTE
jgi:hypothetical protein